MTVRRGCVRAAAFLLVVALPAAGISGVAVAKGKAAPNCTKHPHKAKCLSGSGSGSGTGGSSPQMTLQIDPEPVVETGQSEIHAVLQVETLPSFAGDIVEISSSQLAASCMAVEYESLQNEKGLLITPPLPTVSTDFIEVVLDDDGNATVVVNGTNCAPGPSVISADLEVAPYLTALSTLVASPPAVTPEGVSVNPRFGGLNQELETGDTDNSGESDIYAVFYVETSPVYAEQPVEIGSSQLEARCGQGWVWEAGNPSRSGPYNSPVTGVGANTDPEVETSLDDDGNAVFIFEGGSCAAGPSQVIADVEAGTHPTYVLQFTVLPPAPVI